MFFVDLLLDLVFFADVAHHHSIYLDCAWGLFLNLLLLGGWSRGLRGKALLVAVIFFWVVWTQGRLVRHQAGFAHLVLVWI
jgi:hypothetical protein